MKKLKDDEPIAKKCSSTLFLKGHEPPLPRPFPIPKNFPQNISLALSNKSLTGTNRTSFLKIIAQAIYRFKNYPTDDEYFHVVQEIIKTWPHIENSASVVSD